MTKVESLRLELERMCNETQTRLSGMQKLVEYYTTSLGWSEEKALQYALALFHMEQLHKLNYSVKMVRNYENSRT